MSLMSGVAVAGPVLPRAATGAQARTSRRAHRVGMCPPAAPAALRPAQARRGAVRTAVTAQDPDFARATSVTATERAMMARAKGFWPDPEYIAKVLPLFPEKGIASVDEARVLYSEGGYIIVDVRSKVEYEKDGKIVGSYNIPLINVKRTYDSSSEDKLNPYKLEQSRNTDFLKEVTNRVKGDKSAKIMVVCSDGTDRALQALTILDEAGFDSLVGIKGGMKMWSAVWDPRLRRIRGQTVYSTVFNSPGDALGVFDTGAFTDKGFREDEVLESYSGCHRLEWLEYEEDE